MHIARICLLWHTSCYSKLKLIFNFVDKNDSVSSVFEYSAILGGFMKDWEIIRKD